MRELRQAVEVTLEHLLFIELLGSKVVGFLRSVKPAAIQPLDKENGNLHTHSCERGMERIFLTHKSLRAILPQLLNKHEVRLLVRIPVMQSTMKRTYI